MPHPDPLRSPPEAQDSFDALVSAHYGRLWNFAYRFVGSRDVAEDIVQEVLTRIWQRHEAFDVREPLPYLCQAVRNQATSYCRQQGVRNRWRDRAALAESDPAAENGADLVAADLSDAVARAIQALPERCRLVFTMSREQDLSYAEIARVLGISVKTVETHMGRAQTAASSSGGELPGTRLGGASPLARRRGTARRGHRARALTGG
jgi:RNA polymerase sigma-70 factor (ECF subfamily)